MDDQSTATQSTAARPPVSRPRGRILIAGLLLAACGGGLATVWDSLFRYKAYGVVTARTVEIASPLDGVVKYMLVRDGQSIRQNDPLATITDLESEQKLARISDELRVANATLHAEIAKLQWRTLVEETEMSRSLAEYLESSGNLESETGALHVLRDQLERISTLNQRNAAAASDVQSLMIQEQAQEEKIAGLQQAVISLKERASLAATVRRPGIEQITPLIAQADLLLNETTRLREWISRGELRSPINGVVLRRHHPPGELVASHSSLLTLVEESSTEIELFLPQSLTDDYHVGDRLNVKIEPIPDLVPCVITAIGGEHRRPPEQIEIYYPAHSKLLPVRLRPPTEMVSDGKLAIGAVVRLPHFGSAVR